MEPRHLGVRVVLVKSFARIHETNLKKQGMLGLTFADKSDYDKINEDYIFDLIDIDSFSEGNALTMLVHHNDGNKEKIICNHTETSKIRYDHIESFKNHIESHKK